MRSSRRAFHVAQSDGERCRRQGGVECWVSFRPRGRLTHSGDHALMYSLSCRFDLPSGCPVFLRKLGATIYLLWFALYLGAPQYVHHCPEHSAAAPAPVASSHDAAHGDHGASEKSGDEAHECCCPGPQCGTGTLVVPVDRSVDSLLPGLDPQRPPVRAVQSLSSRSAHVLPFATAPPGLHA